MKSAKYFLAAFAFLGHLAPFIACDKLPCSLEWLTSSSGSKIPPTAVTSSSTVPAYVTRGVPETSTGVSPVIGRLDPVTGYSHIPWQNGEATLLVFEVLTNPYDCELVWVEGSHVNAREPFVVPAEPGSSYHVGRALVNGTLLYPGQVDGNRKRLELVFDDEVLSFTQDSYYVLTSVSEGIKLELSNLVLADDVLGGSADVLGVDEIYNNADAEVVQSVSHSRSMTERFKFTTRSTWTVAKSVFFGGGIGIPGLIGVGGGSSSSESTTIVKETTIEREETKELTVTREIRVPPYASVQACSMLTQRENFTTNWVARARFTCAGMSAAAVIAEVSKGVGWEAKTWTEEGNAAVTEVDGSFGGSLVLSSKFFVVDGADGESGACYAASRYLSARKRAARRNDGTRNEVDSWREEERELLKILNPPKNN